MIWAKTRLYAFISSFLYPLVLLGIMAFEKHADIANYLALLGVFSMFWAMLLYRRYRLIEDTETTTLNSAAQGYVEVAGKASLYEGEIARSLHFEVPPMVWYRKFFYTSWSGFLLRDENGQCTIDPRNAEVITPLYKYNQHIYNAIYPGETIYALGQLETLKKQRTHWELKGLVSRKLIDWKRHKFRFLDYFDSNKDGKIDEGELETARQAALKEVEDDMEQSYQSPATHIISNPGDGRPYILSSIHPDKLIQRYKRATQAHLLAWLVLFIYAAVMV